MTYKIIQGDCEKEIGNLHERVDFFRPVDVTFVDPPFNQGKNYFKHSDKMQRGEYWGWMERIFKKIYSITSPTGALYFMQREKNTEFVLESLRKAGWNFQNLIIWKKKTSAVPNKFRFGKHYQVIAFVTKGKKPRVFNRLRINPPLPKHYSEERENGIFVTDVWTDIRELTSGYFAGEEALRDKDGNRAHKQQSPVKLLARIILSSTKPGDLVLDPFAGTGTTSVVAEQLDRDSIAIEKSPEYVSLIEERMEKKREADDISSVTDDYGYTENLNEIIGDKLKNKIKQKYQEKLPLPS